MPGLIHLFEGQSCATAWLDAVQYVADSKTAYNVVIGIAKPADLRPVDVAIAQRLDRFLESHDSEPTCSVASTIFPAGAYLHGGANEVFNEYPKCLHKIRGRWEGYAARMLSKSLTDGDEQVSPLERLLRKMKSQTKRGGLRAVYDLSLDDPADPFLELAIYKADTDSGLIHPPCLMHLSFKMAIKQIHLTALYRNHYYVQKVLGNLLGLAQLQLFVAEQVGDDFEPGTLVCHSTYASFDDGGRKWKAKEARAMIGECLDIYASYDSSTANAIAQSPS